MFGDSEHLGCALAVEEDPRGDRPQRAPRLKESDLSDPQAFHRRLAEWLMRQK